MSPGKWGKIKVKVSLGSSDSKGKHLEVKYLIASSGISSKITGLGEATLDLSATSIFSGGTKESSG